MKINNKFLKLIFSYIAIIVAAYILSIGYFRLDLTSEGKYTLSDYTMTLLENIDDDVYIKVYLDGADLPIHLKKMQQAVKEELQEFSIYANKNFDFEFINPTENEDKNIRYGIYKMLMDKGLVPIEIHEKSDAGSSSQRLIFPSVIISYKGRSIGVNLLKNTLSVAPESEQNISYSIQSLEYELTNALQKLTNDKKPEIAFIEGQKELSEYQVMDISNVLSEYYSVQRGRIDGTIGILDNFKAIIIAKPRAEFSEQDKFVLDQYIMQGGNVLWMLEGADTNLDSLFVTAATIAMAQENNLGDMLFNYGIRVNANLLQDKFSSPIGILKKSDGGKPKIDLYPWNYFPVIVTDDKHPISKYLNYIKTEFVSTIDTVGNNPKIKKTVLLHSSQYSFVENVPARVGLDMINYMQNDTRLNKGKKNIAVLLEGEFSSNFINRNTKTYLPAGTNYKFLKKSKVAKMIVVSDADIIKNEVAQDGRPYPIGYDKFSQRTYDGNKEFILNAVNYLCDDAGLMTIRSRELQMRLLNVDKIKENRFLIQFINVIAPIILIILFGIGVFIFRKRKYTS